MTGLLAISDDLWTRMFLAVIGLIIAITNAINLWVSWRSARKIDDVARTGEMAYDRSNSALGRALRVAAVALRSKADQTNHPGDLRAAEIAEREAIGHEEGQARIDKKFDTDKKAT